MAMAVAYLMVIGGVAGFDVAGLVSTAFCSAFGGGAAVAQAVPNSTRPTRILARIRIGILLSLYILTQPANTLDACAPSRDDPPGRLTGTNLRYPYDHRSSTTIM